MAGLIVFAVLVSAAGPAGTWKGEMVMNPGTGEMKAPATLVLVVSGSKVRGTMTANGRTDEILSGSFRGGVVSFVIASGMDDIQSFTFSGSVKGDSLTLRIRGRLDEESPKVVDVGSARLRRAQ